ncbi:hypothetical protein QR680_018386 [Steinernema hermaphroditum]|uniref:Uncharacterized protein n=1 Tax=Steinernema hermaphroditum TaxID=289476 RepID=A0AA39HHT4_9BILA|nr:hypothetical protein QR680_018386 [Steinernema hermaphroditum]
MHEKMVDDDLYFFGESYRGCCGLCHIIITCHLTLIAELVKLVTLFALLGDLHTVTVFYVTITVISVLLAFVGLIRDKFALLWPYLVLKMLEATFMFIAAVIIFVLMMSGFKSRRFLADTVRMRYTALKDDQALGVSLLFFFLLVLLSALNAFFIRTVFRCQRYLKKKWMTGYLIQRRYAYKSFFGR